MVNYYTLFDEFLDCFSPQEVLYCSKCFNKLDTSHSTWKFNNYYYNEWADKNLRWLADEKYCPESTIICNKCAIELKLSRPCY